MEIYLTPMLKAGMLTMTEPETPDKPESEIQSGRAQSIMRESVKHDKWCPIIRVLVFFSY